MKGYIEERAVEIANYIIETNTTVRETAKVFGVSKSTVHKAVSYTHLDVYKRQGQTMGIGLQVVLLLVYIRHIPII